MGVSPSWPCRCTCLWQALRPAHALTVRFDILLPAAAQSGLKISVRLLGVARRVK